MRPVFLNITIDEETGAVTLDVEGAIGEECLDLARELEALLGQPTTARHKPELQRRAHHVTRQHQTH